MLDMREMDIIRLEAEAFVTDLMEEIVDTLMGNRRDYMNLQQQQEMGDATETTQPQVFGQIYGQEGR